jgi:hypothetical protein
MTTETKLRGGIVLLTLTLLWSIMMWNNSIITVEEQKNTIVKLTKVTDSLHDELFNAQVEIGRHEITREEILKPNKELNKKYEKYYNHETE